MERMLTKKATAAGCTMEVTVMKIGEDFQICLSGGEKPHIGCVVQAARNLPEHAKRRVRRSLFDLREHTLADPGLL